MKVTQYAVTLMLSISACGDRNAPTNEHADEEVHADSLRVTLSEAAYQTAGIEVAAAVGENVSEAERGLEVPGDVDIDPRRVTILSPRVNARIERSLVVSGDRVHARQAVALLYTPSFITAQTEFLQARRRAVLLANTADAQGANALAAAAENRLRQIGALEDDIAQLAKTGDISEYLKLVAPFSGRIIESFTLAGTAIEAGAPVFKLADLTFVDVNAAVPEQSIPLVRVGTRASVRIAAYPQMTFSGEVERIEQQLNESTRTIGAIIHVRNINETLKPGMFATVRLELPAAATTSTGTSRIVTIPGSAVVNEGDRRFVFIEVAPRTYEKREVETASLEPPGASQPITDRIVARSGIRPGERVVVRGAFILKSELGKGELDEHGH